MHEYVKTESRRSQPCERLEVEVAHLRKAHVSAGCMHSRKAQGDGLWAVSHSHGEHVEQMLAMLAANRIASILLTFDDTGKTVSFYECVPLATDMLLLSDMNAYMQ